MQEADVDGRESETSETWGEELYLGVSVVGLPQVGSRQVTSGAFERVGRETLVKDPLGLFAQGANSAPPLGTSLSRIEILRVGQFQRLDVLGRDVHIGRDILVDTWIIRASIAPIQEEVWRSGYHRHGLTTSLIGDVGLVRFASDRAVVPCAVFERVGGHLEVGSVGGIALHILHEELVARGVGWVSRRARPVGKLVAQVGLGQHLVFGILPGHHFFFVGKAQRAVDLQLSVAIGVEGERVLLGQLGEGNWQLPILTGGELALVGLCLLAGDRYF